MVRPERVRDEALLSGYDALLSDDEQAKCRRFRFDKDRHCCLVTRALLRTTLSRYTDVPPGAWRFVLNPHGRPEIDAPREARWLKFNLSHTNGLVVCLVARERAIGVDVEDRERGGRLLDVAERFFSPSEAAALRALPENEQLDRFFLYWTLKESYIKARGMGLAIPLSQFSFDIGPGITVRFDPRLGDDPESWQFTALGVGRRHAVAAAFRRCSGDTVRLFLHETVPVP